VKDHAIRQLVVLAGVTWRRTSEKLPLSHVKVTVVKQRRTSPHHNIRLPTLHLRSPPQWYTDVFETVENAPPDAILGLSEAFGRDPNPEKINLAVGVYKDENGQTPILPSVLAAREKLVAADASAGYLPIPGAPQYAAAVQELLWGTDHAAVTEKRVVTAHTPGGTGALRVAGDFIHKIFPDATLWLSEPTWPNHPPIFKAAGVPTKTYSYLDATATGLDFEAMIAALRQMPADDAVLLHGCCHNPTGVDPTAEQWSQIASVVRERKLLPLLDFAYQGFAEGINEDAVGLNALSDGGELIVCNSFSKNFGLYRERVGAISLLADSPEAASAVMSQVKGCIRTNYSNPPAHGGGLVTTVLGDAALRSQWENEVRQMRDRINGMRTELVEGLAAQGVDRDFSFIQRQRGMFSFSGLTREQVDVLREKHSIYIVGSGRINVAGITPANIDRLCEAIASVL